MHHSFPTRRSSDLVARWQSFAAFDGRGSLSTCVWRVAHNRATSHMLANKRHAQRGWASIEDVEIADADATPFERADSDRAMALILSIIDRLDPPEIGRASCRERVCQYV